VDPLKRRLVCCVLSLPWCITTAARPWTH